MECKQKTERNHHRNGVSLLAFFFHIIEYDSKIKRKVRTIGFEALPAVCNTTIVIICFAYGIPFALIHCENRDGRIQNSKWKRKMMQSNNKRRCCHYQYANTVSVLLFIALGWTELYHILGACGLSTQNNDDGFIVEAQKNVIQIKSQHRAGSCLAKPSIELKRTFLHYFERTNERRRRRKKTRSCVDSLYPFRFVHSRHL